MQKEDEHLLAFTKLTGTDASKLRQALTHRRIVTGREEFTKPMNFEEANNCRDALAKLLYGSAFNWIVDGINKSLNIGKYKSFIGVLDIYGFETFEVNSFEQFCINYANEKLQQQFNQVS